MEVRPYCVADRERWDAFCADAINATLLHTRRFLEYHGARITDRSLLVLEDGKLLGLLPAGEWPSRPQAVVSHPGATYGGLVHQGRLAGTRAIEALCACRDYFGQMGKQNFVYKPLPHIYHRRPSQDDLYALFRLGAVRIRCDLASVIDLTNRAQPSERRRRGLKKASGRVQLASEERLLPALWDVVIENLARKHEASPVHSFEEIALLQSLFPDQILVRCGLMDGKVEAGVILFATPTVWHAQYIAASSTANEASALDALFDAAIAEARQAGARFFDFGTSNEDAGLVLNDGLYRFKTEFGGGGVAYEHYDWELRHG